MLKIFETDMSKRRKFKDTDFYKKILRYVMSSEMVDLIMEISMTNETQNSQCEIVFDK